VSRLLAKRLFGLDSRRGPVRYPYPTTSMNWVWISRPPAATLLDTPPIGPVVLCSLPHGYEGLRHHARRALLKHAHTRFLISPRRPSRGSLAAYQTATSCVSRLVLILTVQGRGVASSLLPESRVPPPPGLGHPRDPETASRGRNTRKGRIRPLHSHTDLVPITQGGTVLGSAVRAGEVALPCGRRFFPQVPYAAREDKGWERKTGGITRGRLAVGPLPAVDS